ncbi:MAG: xanthine dehydrogenase small subunit [Burkholderiaceae bacterium]|nr:xanthine dehydrogenase small subunit [Burkholderiaceae bacterium]
MSARPIRFFHRGRIVEVGAVSPTRTVLQWLREDQRATGTKEGCAEGDCGACTVLVGELDERGGLRLESVNACIRFLPTLDGKALFTVEDLPASPGHRLHPAQQAMVECHGSQCGFCTPGFVMSLAGCYERHQASGTRPTRQQLADELSGNLCRCTGYRPILDAGERMFDSPTARLPLAAATDALRALGGEPLDHAGPSATVAGRSDHFHAPRTLAQLAALRVAKPQARLVAGATDVGLWVNKQHRDLGDMIYLGDVAELRRIEVDGALLRIGAAASLEDAWSALAQRWPSLTEAWLRFASPPIRHAGTLGGNVANGSPIGDSAPVLIALDALLVLRQGDVVRRLPLTDFYVDYMVNRLQAGEFLQAIEVPLATQADAFRAYKISKRFDSDISSVFGAFRLALDGERVRDVRLAFGGMAATVRRAAQAEAALRDQPWTEATVESAAAALANDFTPLTDLRAGAAYRARVAGNLLRRFWLETRVRAPLPAAALSVWARDNA